MGTRSITHIHEMLELGNEIVCSFYRQYDGYIDGHGEELSKWLEGKRLVNGIGNDFDKGRDHNRAGQMAIELMYDFKKETSIECMPTGDSDYGEEYAYHIYYDGQFKILCQEKRSEDFLFCFPNDDMGWRPVNIKKISEIPKILDMPKDRWAQNSTGGPE